MEIYLIRHTTPEVDKGICYGQTDLALAPSFEAEWDVLKEKLPGGIDEIYTSPLRRCRQLAENMGKQLLIDDRLMEMNFGDWEMKAWNDIPPDELNPWMADFVNTAVPGGESFRELISRVDQALEEIVQSAARKIAIVTHAGVIRALLGRVLEMDPQNVFRLNIDYGGTTLISAKGGRYHVKYVNR